MASSVKALKYYVNNTLLTNYVHLESLFSPCLEFVEVIYFGGLLLLLIVTVRPSASWYNENIMTEKRKRRKLERRWRKTGLACKSKAKLPHSEDHESLANAFADFFTDKITAIREELHLCRGGPAEPLVEVSYDGPKFECFKQVSCQELSDLLAKSSIKSCALDPIPATVLKGCLDLLLPFITKLVNCSLQCSVMTESMKQAQLRPLLKKPSLNHELFKNYRPISNLMFISKSCEKAVAVQLKDHVRNNNLDELFQSAYKAGHSTETALLRVQNDVLRAIDNGGCVMLLLLDLSAAFDTVDHSILLSRLSNSFGIAGAVYQGFQSYLSGRTQFVAVGNARSSCRHLTCCT